MGMHGATVGPWRASMPTNEASVKECSHERMIGRERERERVFVLLGIILAWVWDGLGAFPKEPFKFPSFCGILIGYTP